MRPSALEDFALERYFARWEFTVAHQLSASDVEPYSLRDLLALADDDAKRRWESLSLGYSESSGLSALRDEIAGLYSRVTADQVLVVAGAQEGIFLTMHSCLGSGDEAIVVTPAYQSLHSVARSIGAHVHEVPLRRERQWALDPDEVARHVGPRTRLIVVNYPHNPTGALITPDVQRRLVGIAETAGAVLFSDEVYRGLEHSGAEQLPPAADLSERAVSLGVMSKAFALAGLRVGWLATRDARLMAEVARLKDYTTICNSAPSEILALIALRAKATVLGRSRAIVAENLALADTFMRRFESEIAWLPLRAGSTAFPRFRRRSADAVAQTLAERASVLLVPGSIFGCEPESFRVGLGRRDFPIALEKFGALLSDPAHR